MTRAEYGLHIGKSRQRVDQLVKEGTITLNPDGTIDPNRGDVELAQANKLHNQVYMEQLARKTSLQADRLALDLRARRGALISSEEALDFWVFTVANLKSRLRALPTKLATELAFLEKPAACQQLLLREIDGLLNEMVTTVEGWKFWPNDRTLEEKNGETKSKTNGRTGGSSQGIQEDRADF